MELETLFHQRKSIKLMPKVTRMPHGSPQPTFKNHFNLIKVLLQTHLPLTSFKMVFRLAERSILPLPPNTSMSRLTENCFFFCPSRKSERSRLPPPPVCINCFVCLVRCSCASPVSLVSAVKRCTTLYQLVVRPDTHNTKKNEAKTLPLSG